MADQDDLELILAQITQQETKQEQKAQNIQPAVQQPVQQPVYPAQVYQPQTYAPSIPPQQQQGYVVANMQPQPAPQYNVVYQMQPMQPPMNHQQPINNVNNQKQAILTPQQAANIDIRNVHINPDQQYQIYVGDLPPQTQESELRAVFQHFGEIKTVQCTSQNYGFVNYKTRSGAIAALKERNILLRGKHVTLATFHKKIQVILRRLPPKVNDSSKFQQILDDFITEQGESIFVYAQLAKATYGYAAYLQFLSIDESIKCFELLKTTKFTEYCAAKYELIPDISQLRIVTNEQVAQREKEGSYPNQDTAHEVLQFMCLRYVDKPKGNQGSGHQQIAQVNQYNIQQPIQQQYVQQLQPQYVQYQQQSYQNQLYTQQPIIYQPQQHISFPQHQNGGGNRGKTVSTNSVYIKMMPFKTTQEEVRAAMSQFGQVQHIALINDKEAQGMNPCAIVYMNSGIQQALDAQQVIIKPDQPPARILVHTKKQ